MIPRSGPQDLATTRFGLYGLDAAEQECVRALKATGYGAWTDEQLTQACKLDQAHPGIYVALALGGWGVESMTRELAANVAHIPVTRTLEDYPLSDIEVTAARHLQCTPEAEWSADAVAWFLELRERLPEAAALVRPDTT